MKIKSTKDYFQDAGFGYGLVVFKGEGTVDGTDTDTAKIYPLHDAIISFSKSKVPNYLVTVTTTVGVIVINLQDDNGQETWVNTEAGKDACIKDLIKWANEAKGISGGSMTVGGSVAVSNFPDAVKGYNDYDHTKTFDDNGNIVTDIYKTKGTTDVVQTVTYLYDASGNNTLISTT